MRLMPSMAMEPFVYQVGIEFGGDANAQPPVVIAEGIEGEEFAGAIDVALDDVAVQAAAGGERALQVDARAGAQVAQVAAACRVSGARSAENESGRSSAAVRQTPLTAMLAPTEASPSTVEQRDGEARAGGDSRCRVPQ